jgi:uncharacterized protein YggE
MMDNMYVQRELRYAGWLCIALIVLVLALAVNAIKENRYIGGGVPSSNVISVSGDGSVFGIPDIAQFSFSVTSEKATLGDAQDDSAKKINAIIDSLKKQGVDEKDIQTSNYSANPRYEYRADATPAVGAPTYYPQPGGRQVLVGYDVTQTITVKVRDTKKVGDIVSSVGTLGATDIFGPTFTIDDQKGLEREARKKAIDDAREKAKELAADLGAHLVRIVSFSENGNYPMPYYGLGGAMEATASDAKVAPQIPAGQNEISSHISITYEIR